MNLRFLPLIFSTINAIYPKKPKGFALKKYYHQELMELYPQYNSIEQRDQELYFLPFEQEETFFTHLHLSKNTVHYLPSLTEHNLRVESIDLIDCNIVDLSPLEKFTELRYIELSNTNITDLEPLRNLKNLTGLFLRNTTIKDISPLIDCLNLKKLDLQGTNVEDLSPLVNCISLEEINIKDTKIQYGNKQELLKSILSSFKKYRKIRVNDKINIWKNCLLPAIKRDIKPDFNLNLKSILQEIKNMLQNAVGVKKKRRRKKKTIIRKSFIHKLNDYNNSDNKTARLF
jgi:hypothetical protein